MPCYEYQCVKCGVFTEQQLITADKLKNCPICKSSVERLISLSSFSLKGSGWTKTDAVVAKANMIEKRLEAEEISDRKKGIVTL